MDTSAATPGAPVIPSLQQVMSPTNVMIEGETRGPDYGRTALQPLRSSQNEFGMQGAAPMSTGAGPTPVDGDTLGTANPSLVPGSAASVTVQDVAPRQIPQDGGTVEASTPCVRNETGLGARTNVFTGMERDEMRPTDAGIFPQFTPSPLPGQSPVAAQGGTTTRAAAWLSRLGDYLQKTVEVTSWTAHSPVGHTGSWPAHGAPSPTTHPATQTYAAQQVLTAENRPPSSSGSAGISPELVQAEVARQLEAAMGDLNQQLRRERERSDEAMREAQELRRKLEIQEMRATMDFNPTAIPALPPPPGLQRGEDVGPGVCTGVTTSHPPSVPGLCGPLPHRENVPVSDDPVRGQGSMGREGLLSGLPQNVDQYISGAGVSGVTASHPSSGPLVSIPMPKVRSRSQSPGARTFLQGLFGRGGQNKHGLPADGPCGRTAASVVEGPHLPMPTTSVPTPGANPEGNLLTTMARGIEALLRQQEQMGPRADRPETVKPGITDLPRLPEYQPMTGSIDLLNWLTHIQPIMEDLSDTSYAWWEGTLQDAAAWYASYSAASPLERLRLKPLSSEGLHRPEWARVERRATAMMLSAVPGQVREEVIAMGNVSWLALLCKLYAVYQPGNLQEKSLVLQKLERPDECDTALQAVEALRKWTLWRRRASSIGIAEPDASVLIQGLDRITTKVVKANSELSFRVSLIRSTLQVDVCPSLQSVTSFHQHLQAEMEQQARLSVTQGSGGGTPGLRAITAPGSPGENSSALAATSPTTPPKGPASGLCKYFLGDRGCRRGNTCRFPHTWSLLEKGMRSKKCLACGSAGHKVKECKAPGGGAARSGGARSTTTGAGETGSTSPTASSPGHTQRKVEFVEVEGEIGAKVLKVLSEVQHLPMVKSLMDKIREWMSTPSPTSASKRLALLDSGATHVLRAPTTSAEWELAREVKVQLAGDSVMAMKQNDAGSLLTGDQLAQVIVPLGKVIQDLGYQLLWTSEVCELVGPQGDVLPLTIRNGCPEVSEKVAYRLIQQLEAQQLPELEGLTQASMCAIAKLKSSWWSYLKEYIKTGDVTEARRAVEKASFFDYKDVLKEEMITRIPREGIWDLMKNLRVNRRARKRLMRASSWIVRWDVPAVDRAADPMKHLMFVGDMVYLNMNTMLIENEFVDLWKVVQWAAINGRIGVVVANDGLAKPFDQVVARPHRSKVHFLHALATAAREVHGGEVVRLYIEDLERVRKVKLEAEDDVMSTWPPWTLCRESQSYLEEMGLFDVSIGRSDDVGAWRIAKLSSDAAWRLHVARNHQPFRRDCSVCVRNSAAGHQHRTTAHPMAYTLSVDVVGPLKGFGRSPDGKFFKYFVIGAMRIPKVDGAEGHGDVRGFPLPPPEPEEEDRLSEEEEALEEGGALEAGGVDPSDVEREEQQWKELMSSFKEPILTTTLYFAVPVNNKKAATMLPAVQRIVTDVKALGYPITRIHSDRGGEFRGNLVRKWALSQGMWPTTTSGSDSAANGVAESGVRYLKRRARVLLDSAGVGREHWPTAVQYAAAEQRSQQLGTLPMMPVAYGARVYVKTKRYKTGAVEDFGPHWTRGRYAGSSTDIRGGHVIIKDTGTFIQTTHVRITKEPPPLEEVTPTVVVESHVDDEGLHEEPPLPPPSLPPPLRRVRTKAPVISKVERTYPQAEVLYEAPDDEDLIEEEERGLKYLRVGEVQYVEAIAKQLYQEAKFAEDDVARLLSLFAGTCGNLRVPRAPKGKGLIIGAYVHGGAFGLTRYGRDLPWVARYFNNYLSRKIYKQWPSWKCSWTTLAIQAASEIPKHRDNHNQRGTYNYVMELKTDSLEGLWVQDRDDRRQVVGGSDAQDYQYEEQDGKMYDGCLVNVKEDPAAFDPLVPHAYVKGDGEKWFLSAYTPQGAYKLSGHDLKYLEDVGFPLRLPDEEHTNHGGALETTPVLKAASSLSGTSLSGARGEDVGVDASTVGDCEATLWDWAMYVEEEPDPFNGEATPTIGKTLRRVCASEDPGVELGALTKAPELLNEEELEVASLLDMEENVEYWSSLGLYDSPRVAKMEPEYVEGIETIITKAVETGTPLRHTYNVSPQEAKAVIEKWRPAILKELGVVERGFKRITTTDIARLRGTAAVQELPSKLVYTVKPPSGDEHEDERAYCRRKARIVCCGNYAAEDQNELYAGGAAAESLRCVLAYTARRKWRSGITDITGAFMLTPLPTGVGQVIYIIRPPAALVQLGLVDPQERWQLTHGMYGLRQSPKLWSSFRDSEMKKMVVEHDGKVWVLQQGTAEPNMWLVRQEGAPPDQEPDGLVLVYVDDIFISGPAWLVDALSSTIRGVWKASPLELLEVNHEIRFLGCEIAVSEEYDAIYVHQRPYIEEILRQYSTPETEQSPIQAPKELVSFEAREGEECGTEEQIKQAQKACGELLWIAQRSRPDISFVVCAMGSLLTRAAPRCLSIAARLRSYLQRTKGMALCLRPANDYLIVYSDSSFAPEGSKSHSGFVAVWLGAPVCWRSARQPFTCLSTAECELLAATEGLVMGKSIESVLGQMMPKVGAIHLKVDNQAAISLAKPSSSSSWRTRHLRVRASYIHEQVVNEQVTVTFVAGKHQWADLLTKSFPRQRLEELIKIWGFVDMTIETSKIAVVRALVACMMVQTARAQEETPLALTMSFELYVMVIMLGIVAVALWEFLWWCVDRCCGEARPSRSARRLRNLQETVQKEIEAQIAERHPTTSPLPGSSTRTSEPTGSPPAGSPMRDSSPMASCAASSTTRLSMRRTPQPPAPEPDGPTSSAMSYSRSMTRDAGVQIDARPLLCYQDREVPVPVPDPSGWNYPLYVSPSGDTFHTYESCWGLRNTRARAVRFCQCCRDNHGRSLRDRGRG